MRAGTTLALAALLAGPGLPAAELPFAPGEKIALRISYAHILAGRAWLSVARGTHLDRPALEFVAEAKSQGFFAWLFRFRVEDRTVARWDPADGCSLSIEKHLREGRAERDQVVTFDPAGRARVEDRKVQQKEFELQPCTLDVLSAFFVTRVQGVPEQGQLELPVFDNGKHYRLGVRFLGRETLDLPRPLGRGVRTVVIEPQLVQGTGLFVKEGRLKIWLTDDARRIPVRLRSKVAIGSVSAELESYEPGRP